MTHTRLHIRFRTLDVIVKVVAEELDMRDGSGRDVGVGEVAREEDKGHVANFIRVSETRDLPNLERGVPIREEHLRRVLDLRQAACVHEFLWDLSTLGRIAHGWVTGTCRKTFPKMRSVSSRKTVEKMTVTRSCAAWI